MNHTLGFFEVAQADAEGDFASARTAASTLLPSLELSTVRAQLVVKERQQEERNNWTGGENYADASTVPDVVGMTLVLEVPKEGVEIRTSSAQSQETMTRGENPSSGASAAQIATFSPSREDVEAAAAVAAREVTDREGAQAAISALACWNLAMTTSENATAQFLRVEITAAFGYSGEWYTSSKVIALTEDARSTSLSSSSSPQPRVSNSPPLSSPSDTYSDSVGEGEATIRLSATFNWQPAGNARAKLDGPIVADVKIYGETTPTKESVHQGISSDVLPAGSILSHGTVCKRASASDSTGSLLREGDSDTAMLQANLIPVAEQRTYGRRTAQLGETADGGRTTGGRRSGSNTLAVDREQPDVNSPIPKGSVASTPTPLVVVSEISDPEWWSAQEEKEYGRGMQAVHALKRLTDWELDQWKKQRQRGRKQETEKERRRAKTAADRREKARTEREGGGRRKRNDAREMKAGPAKRVWEAMGRRLRRVWRKLGRKRNE